MSPDPYVQQPGNSQSYNRYSYCVNNPLKYTDKNGYWFGWDDLVAAAVGAVVGYVSYGVTTGDWGHKAFAAAGIGAAVAWLGWNTFGAGATLASSSSFGSGVTAVFSAGSSVSGLGFGTQFAAFTVMNVASHGAEMTAGDRKGWGGVGLFAGDAVAGALSAGGDILKPKLSDGIKAFASVTVLDNVSDNTRDGVMGFHSIHVGPIGWDHDRQRTNHADGWGGFYTIGSPGLTGDQRFEMGFETVLALCSIKENINIDYRSPRTSIGTLDHFWGPMERAVIPTAEIGYYSRLGYTAVNNGLGGVSDALGQFGINDPYNSLADIWWKGLFGR